MFLDIAGGDRGLATLLRVSLERLQDGVAGDLLREMARDVLGGGLDLRQAGTSDVYEAALDDHLGRYHEWVANQSPDELSSLADAAQSVASRLKDDEADHPLGRPADRFAGVGGAAEIGQYKAS